MKELKELKELKLTLRKTRGYYLIYLIYLFIFTALVFLGKNSSADERWREIIWKDGAEPLAGFEALCLESGLTSADVLEANGYSFSAFSEGNFPRAGDELLIPSSKSNLSAAWIEAQSRKIAAPLVTVKLHGVPRFAQREGSLGGAGSASEEVNQRSLEPAETAPQKNEPEKQISPKNMSVIVSGDEIVLRSRTDELIEELLRPGSAASRDIIIRDPPELKPTVAPPPGTQRKMIWPVDGKVSSGFGRRSRWRMHDGLDIPMPAGTPIAAAQDGVVLETAANSGNYRGYGNVAVIDHGNGVVALYAHCSKLNVKKGQRVRLGDIVAFVGRTGRSTTNHLHFEIRKNGKAVDPTPYLIPR